VYCRRHESRDDRRATVDRVPFISDTSLDTPVVAVVTDLGYLRPARIQGQRQLLGRASRLCGTHVARFSSAVMFDDGLDIVCCLPPITLFVVRTDRNLRVYPWPHH
jgi:hypothetical protein